MTTDSGAPAEMVFLLAPPRAGSTLLQRCLAGADEVATNPETWFVPAVLAPFGADVVQTEFGWKRVRIGLEPFARAEVDLPTALQAAARQSGSPSAVRHRYYRRVLHRIGDDRFAALGYSSDALVARRGRRVRPPGSVLDLLGLALSCIVRVVDPSLQVRRLAMRRCRPRLLS